MHYLRSFGVYTHVTLNPLTVLVHDELLVLFSSRGYGVENDTDVPGVGVEDDQHVKVGKMQKNKTLSSVIHKTNIKLAGYLLFTRALANPP